MKKIFGGLLGLVLFLVLARTSLANEGVIRLFGNTEADGKCYAVSIYVDGSYRLMMTCRGLKVAADPVLNRYVAWAEVSGKNLRLGEIVAGKMQGNLQDKFDYVFVTVEKDGYPTSASESVVMSGRMEAIDFGKGVKDETFVRVTTTQVEANTTSSTATSKASTVTTTSQTASSNKLVTVVTGVGKAILLGFILLLVIVGIMGFLSRRKSL